MPTPCYEQVIYGPDVTSDPEGALWNTVNALIPLTGKHRLTTTKVYGDDEVQPLYDEHTLDLETVIYYETSTGPSDNMEAEVSRIRDILLTPGLQLDISSVGLGNLSVINYSNFVDVKGGPFPQTVTVEPIASNKAILVQWSVMFRTVTCPTTIELLQYTVEQDMNVDDNGNMEFTIHITYQSKNPVTNPNSLIARTNILTARAEKSFQGMTKKKRTSMSRDQRIVSIVLTYSEIESDNAFFPNTAQIQVNDEMESELLGTSVYAGKGFYTWRRSISGTIKLPARIHKAYAWLVFLKILKERFKNLEPFDKVAAVLSMTKASGQENTDTVKEKQYYLPLKIKLVNSIYTREMKFDVSYLVATDLKSLIKSSKIFDRVNTSYVPVSDPPPPDPLPPPTANNLSEQWFAWQTAKNVNLNGRFQYTIDGTPIVYNQCTGVTSEHKVGPNVLLLEEIETQPYPTDPEEQYDKAAYPLRTNTDPETALKLEYSWLKYDNDFEIIEQTNNMNISYLEEPVPTYYTNEADDGAYSSRTKAGMSLYGKQANSTQTYPNKVIPRGHSTFLVRMKGHALRLGFKIPIPFIETVAGKTVNRTGNPIMTQKVVSAGDVPVYLAKWDITYAVVGGDIFSADVLTNIVTTGDPGAYI